MVKQTQRHCQGITNKARQLQNKTNTSKMKNLQNSNEIQQRLGHIQQMVDSMEDTGQALTLSQQRSQRQIQKLTSSLNAERSKLLNVQIENKDLKNQIDELKKQCGQFQSSINHIKQKQSEHESQLESLSPQRNVVSQNNEMNLEYPTSSIFYNQITQSPKQSFENLQQENTELKNLLEIQKSQINQQKFENQQLQKSQLDTAAVENDLLKSKVTFLTQQLEQSQTMNKQQTEQIKQIQAVKDQQIEYLNNQVVGEQQKLLSQNKSMQVLISSQQQDLAELHAERQKLQRNISTLQQEKSGLSAAVEEAERKSQIMHQEAETKAELLKNQLKMAEQERKRLIQDRVSQELQISELQTQIQTKDAQNAQLQNERQIAQMASQQLSQQLHSKEILIRSQQNEEMHLKERLEQTISDLQKNLHNKEIDVKSKMQHISQLSNHIACKENELELLKEQLLSQIQQSHQIEVENKTLQNKLKNHELQFQQKIDQKQVLINSLQQQLDIERQEAQNLRYNMENQINSQKNTQLKRESELQEAQKALVAGYEAQIKSLQSQLQSTLEELQQQKDMNATLTNEQTSQDQKQSQLISQLQSQVQQLQNRCDLLNKENDFNQQKLLSTANERQQNQKEIRSLQERLTLLNKSLADNQEQFKLQNEKLLNDYTQKAEEAQILTKIISDKEAQLQGMQSEAGQKSQEINELNTQISSLKIQIQQQNDKIAQITQTNRSQQELQLQQQSAERQAHTTVITQKNEEINDLNNQIISFKRQIDQLNSELFKQKEINKQGQRETENMRTHYKELELQIQEQQQQFTVQNGLLQSQYDQKMAEQKEVLQKIADDKQNQILILENKIAGLQQLVDLKENEKLAQIQAHQNELFSTAQAREELQKEIKKLSDELAKKNKDVQNYELLLKEVQAQYDTDLKQRDTQNMDLQLLYQDNQQLSIKQQQQINQLQASIQKQQNEINEYQLQAQTLDSYREQVRVLENNYQTQTQEHLETKIELQKMQLEIEHLMKDKQLEANQFTNQIENIKAENTNLSNQLTQLMEEKLQLKEQNQNDVTNLSEQIQQITQQYEQKIVKLDVEVTNLTKEVNVKDTEVKNLNTQLFEITEYFKDQVSTMSEQQKIVNKNYLNQEMRLKQKFIDQQTINQELQTQLNTQNVKIMQQNDAMKQKEIEVNSLVQQNNILQQKLLDEQEKYIKLVEFEDLQERHGQLQKQHNDLIINVDQFEKKRIEQDQCIQQLQVEQEQLKTQLKEKESMEKNYIEQKQLTTDLNLQISELNIKISDFKQKEVDANIVMQQQHQQIEQLNTQIQDIKRRYNLDEYLYVQSGNQQVSGQYSSSKRQAADYKALIAERNVRKQEEANLRTEHKIHKKQSNLGTNSTGNGFGNTSNGHLGLSIHTGASTVTPMLRSGREQIDRQIDLDMISNSQLRVVNQEAEVEVTQLDEPEVSIPTKKPKTNIPMFSQIVQSSQSTEDLDVYATLDDDQGDFNRKVIEQQSYLKNQTGARQGQQQSKNLMYSNNHYPISQRMMQREQGPVIANRQKQQLQSYVKQPTKRITFKQIGQMASEMNQRK